MDLIEAAMVGSLERVKRELSAGTPVDFEDPGGQSALFWAAMNDDAAVLSTLLAAGASIDKRNMGGQTALMGAAMKGKDPCLDVLLAGGAALDAADQDGLTAWAWAALSEQRSSCEKLKSRGADTMAHHFYSAAGKPTVTLNDLSKCDGVQSASLQLACMGLVFDLSQGHSFYGPGASYHSLVGRDATSALARHSLSDQGPPLSLQDMVGLPIDARLQVENWTAKFKQKYPIVRVLPVLAAISKL